MGRSPDPGRDERTPTSAWIVRGDAQPVPLATDVELASSFLARFLGLMGRRGLAEGAALWLPGANGIHMLWMRFPIDCVFLGRPAPDGRRRVVAIRRRLPPWRGVVWFVRGAHGALEMPAGAADGAGLRIDDEVRLQGL